MSGRRILVLCEDLQIHPAVAEYSAALAQRMDARVTLLMLVSNELAATLAGDDQRVERTVQQMTAAIADNGTEVQWEVRTGDPRSEVYKFIAARAAFDFVVWGGESSALAARPSHAEHWVRTVSTDLNCPVLSPEKRS